jgi:hypothetical protein
MLVNKLARPTAIATLGAAWYGKAKDQPVAALAAWPT